MLSEIYLFGELNSGYTQYPDDYTKSIFSSFAATAKSKTQLLIHREENTVYYSYIRKLSSRKYIGICYVVSGRLIIDYSGLFSIFEDVISTMVSRGGILEFSNQGEVTSSLDKLYNQKAEVASVSILLKSELSRLDAAKIVLLPPLDYSVSTSESKTFSIDSDTSSILQALGIYANVLVTKDKNIDTDSLKSYSSKLKSNQKQISNLKGEVSALQSENRKLLNKQRNTLWISLLAIVVVVMGVVVWNQVLFPNEVTKKNIGKFVYYGPISNGEPNGVGVAIYPKNDPDGRLYYYGQFVNGQRVDSNAIMFYKNGSYFHGRMEDDQWIEGMMFDVDNAHFVGEFQNNIPWNGRWYKHEVVQRVVNGK